MKNHLLLIKLSILALILSSCASSENAGTAPPPAPSPAATPGATPSPGAPPEMVAQAPTNQGVMPVIPVGIEPSTNPEQRRSEIVTGRSDPFGVITIQPKVTVKKDTSIKTGGPVKTGGGATPGGPVKTGGGATPGGTVKTGGGATLGSPVTNPGGKNTGKIPIQITRKPGEKLPPVPPPDPVIAKAVEITGIVELNGIPYAIVKSPEEPFSRYVQSGQYLAQGQVLVKRIDTYASNPSVVLEQYGVQVVKEVGEKPENTEDNNPGKTAAFVETTAVSISTN